MSKISGDINKQVAVLKKKFKYKGCNKQIHFFISSVVKSKLVIITKIKTQNKGTKMFKSNFSIVCYNRLLKNKCMLTNEFYGWKFF